ncbi:MAG: hypothetical protein KKD38_07025 [Candidatus Delongbacteria bacterium]|nr:hypothetical protein [Candidatus Delongbacteria bacterium]MCG2760417.1 hypothetical protein [Candidatus Delongbacteria bacterium]
MKIDKEKAEILLRKWQKTLRLEDYDIKLKLVDQAWRKSGDIKIDDSNQQVILMLNNFNPTILNYEEVIIHELLHLRLWGMDQMIESLIDVLYGEDENDPKREVVYNEFMHKLESTTQNLTKAFVQLGAENKELPFSYVEKQVIEELKKGKENE